MILVFPFDYAQAVLDGFSGTGVEILSSAREADLTNIQELRLFFEYPEWTSGRWAGMQPRRIAGTQPLRLKNEKTVDSMFSDGSEYEQKTPTPIMEKGKVVGMKRYPMRRTSEKDQHPGRARRIAKKEADFNAWCDANASRPSDEAAFEAFA